MAVIDSTTNSSNSTTTKSVAIPTGVVNGTIVLLAVTMDNTGNIDSGHYPAGFTELVEIDLATDGQLCSVAWKRATGPESGTYTYGAIGGSNWVVQAIALSGRHATDPPVAGTANVQDSALTSPITVSANGVTAVAGDDLVFFSFPDVTATGIGNGHTAPSGYTKQEDDELAFSNLSISTKENVSAGATGTVSGTFALTSGTAAIAGVLIRVPAAAGSDTPLTVDSGSLALEGQAIGLLFSQAYSLPVVHGQLALEGQEIPFIIAQPFTDAQLVIEGQQIGTPTQAVIAVTEGQLALQGQTIGMPLTSSLPVVAGQLALSGQVISLRATGLPTRGSALVTRRRRH